MFSDSIIVQSAISAFNNAALAAPAFLWWALLSVPLFVMVGAMSDAVVARLGWTRSELPMRASLVTVVMTLIWLVLFGGNYNVLRDGVSLLPFMTAGILFAAGLVTGAGTRNVALPSWRGAGRGTRLMYVATAVCMAALLVRSDLHAWWGPLLQIGALAISLALGRRSRFNIRMVPGAILIVMAATTVILMQPEFFRFGQLGNLTLAHLVAVMAVGAFSAATVATRNVNPRGRVHHSAYVKLKWMARFISLLGIALFLLTESVPVFLGTTLMIFLSCALTVWHRAKISPDMAKNMFAATLISFGIITVMPVVVVLGILCLGPASRRDFWQDVRALL